MKKSASKVMASALFVAFLVGGIACGESNQDAPFVASNLIGDVNYAELLTDQYSKDYQLKRYHDEQTTKRWLR